jgi:regulatory protein
MIITAIEPQKKRASRVSIFIDGEFAFGLSLDALAELGLKKGQSVTAESAEQWKTTAEFDEAKNAAFTMLTRRIRSEKEIRDKLRKKKFTDPIIQRVVTRLYELKLLSDENFAEALVREKLKRPIGKQALKTKLYQKGIARDTIDSVLESADLNADELCLKAAEKKVKLLSRERDPQKKKKKLSDFLARRGFDWETIRNAMNALGIK